MSKRAAIIITEGATFWVQTIMKARHPVVASEQLLADLRDAVDCIWGEVSWARSLDDNDPEAMRLARVAQRLEELLPKEDS